MTVKPPKGPVGGGHHKGNKDPDRVRKRAFKRSPCGRPPVAPTGLVGEFDRAEGGKHQRIRMKVRWNEVVLDTSGFPILLRHYVVEQEYTANGSDWFQGRRATVSAKDDVDPNDKAHHIFKTVQKNLGYRFRVRAVARDGCRSAWSEWQVVGNPGPDEPPAPSDVRIIDRDVHMRVTLRWDATPDADDDDLFDERINHFIAEISKSNTFATTYRKNRGVKGNHVSFKIDDADENDIFFGRVRSASADKDKSAWIPATLNGNSNPAASPDGVSVGKALNKTKAPKVPTGLTLTFSSNEQQRQGKWRAKCLWNEVVQDVDNNDIDIDRYVVAFQKSNDGSTWTDDPRRVVVNAKDEDADTTAFRLFHFVNEKRWYRFRVRAISETNTRGAWSSWTSGDRPSQTPPPTPTNVTIRHRPKAKDRVVLDWDAPNDSEDSEITNPDIAYFQVLIKMNSSSSPSFASAHKYDKFHVGTKKTFQIAPGNQDQQFSGWVRSVSNSGIKSAWIPATTGGNSSEGASASSVLTGDGVPAGTVRKKQSNVIPEGWLRCNGQLVSTSAWPDLFAVFGYTYGGSGSLFGVPDYRKRAPKGVGTAQALGDNEGETEDQRSDDSDVHRAFRPTNISRHVHNAGALTMGGPGTTQGRATGTATTPGQAHTHSPITGDTGNQGSAHGHGNEDGTINQQDEINSTNAPTGKGHKGRGRMRVHFNVKAEN